jgi:para-aminobenzoate synthetase/4-amino-4-deoxychorismate lyase
LPLDVVRAGAPALFSPESTVVTPPTHSDLAVRRAIAPLPLPDGGRRWLSFVDPVESILAWDLADVVPAMRRVETAADEGLWAVGFVSYDAGPAFDPAIASHRRCDTPLVAFGLFERADNDDELLDELGRFDTGPWTPSVDQDAFECGVRSVKERIAAGDTYQVNLTLRLHARFAGDPLALFRALARAQQGDHLVYLDLGTRALCSASPELFFRSTPLLDGGRRLLSKPMKGTRGRHDDPDLDAELVTSLVRSAKDRAENTMIVDMMRNDFGRVARVGTVAVPELHAVETFPTVHQMVSTVQADTDASLTEVFQACFPPASITGAPKVSTSRIITELETDGRGTYTGTAGLIAPDGTAEFNVAIRSVWVDLDRGRATYGTGGGIVWDSDPTDEWLETRTKTQVVENTPSTFELLETMLYSTFHGIALLDRHLDRLGASAVHFGFDVDLDELRHRLRSIRAKSAQRVRVLVGPTGSIQIGTTPINPTIGEPWDVPVDARPDGSAPVESTERFLRHKTTRRSMYDEARARHPEAPDVILWNERGELTETTIGNLVLDLDGQLYTPPLSSGLLPGTFRAELLDHDKISERILTLDDLHRAAEVFMINSVRGWVPLNVITAKTENPVLAGGRLAGGRRSSRGDIDSPCSTG